MMMVSSTQQGVEFVFGSHGGISVLIPSKQDEVCGEVGERFESAHGYIISMGFFQIQVLA